MSDVEVYWRSIAAKANDPRSWHDLQPQEQMLIIQSINMVLAVLNNYRNTQNGTTGT